MPWLWCVFLSSLVLGPGLLAVLAHSFIDHHERSYRARDAARRLGRDDDDDEF